MPPLPPIVSAKPLPITFSNWLTLKLSGRGAIKPRTVTAPLRRSVLVPRAGATAPLWSMVSPAPLLPMIFSMPTSWSVPRAPLNRAPKAPRRTGPPRPL